MHVYKAPLRDVVCLTSRGCHKLKGGSTGVFTCHLCMSLCQVRCCCTPHCCWAVCVLRGALEIQWEGGFESSRLCLDGTNTHTQAHSRKHRGCGHKLNTLECGCCFTMAATRYMELGEGGATYTPAADSTAKLKKLAVVSLDGPHTLATHSHTQFHINRSTVHGR